MNSSYKSVLRLCLALVMLHLLSGSTSSQAGELSKAEQTKQNRSLLKSAVRCIQHDSLESALRALDSLLAIDPDNPDAYYYKGLAHLHNGDTVLAIADLSTGTAVAPLASRNKLLLARLYLDRGNVNEAQTLIDEVLAIKPSEGEALYLRGLSLLAVQDTAAALNKLEQAIRTGLSKAQK